MKQSTVVAENMFAGNLRGEEAGVRHEHFSQDVCRESHQQGTYHPSIQLDRKTTFVTEVNWYFIPFSDQIQLLKKEQDVIIMIRISSNIISTEHLSTFEDRI